MSFEKIKETIDTVVKAIETFTAILKDFVNSMKKKIGFEDPNA